MSKVSRLLVVDASVMRSAGSTDGIAAECMAVLTDILNICHKAVLTDDIQSEWNKHQSGEAKKWRARMVAKKKIKFTRPDKLFFEEQVESKVPAEFSKDKAELNKDTHLLAAADAADKILLTCDDALLKLCNKYNIHQNLEWLNPRNKTTCPRLQEISRNSPTPSLPFKH